MRKGRNINVCVRRTFGDVKCAFAKFAIVDGKPQHVGCLSGCTDEYNLVPEHDSLGYIIHNSAADDPYKFGQDVIWENLRQNNNGLTYNPDDEDGRMIRRPEDIHPMMHLVPVNRPSHHGLLDDNVVGEIVGHRDLFLVSRGWDDMKVYGKKRFTPCIPTIYGKYDKQLKMIVPRCVRDYSGDIKNWIIITHPETQRQKMLYLCDDPLLNIKNYVETWFKNEKTARRIYDILLAVREGEYINLAEALVNNGIPKQQTVKFMTSISVKSKRFLYGRLNLTWYKKYYDLLGSDKVNLKEEARLMMKRNLINYVVNYPKFQKPVTGAEFSTDERYWDLYTLIKKAIKRKVILPEMVEKFPKWLLTLITSVKKIESTFVLFGETYSYNSAPKEAKNDMIDSILERVQTNKPQALYPAMEVVPEMIDITKDEEETYIEFIDILRAGRYWNKPELLATWREFKHAFGSNDPHLFWNFIEGIVDCDRVIAGERLGEGEISNERVFAENLLSLRDNRDSFVVRQHEVKSKWDILISSGRTGSPVYAKDLAWIALAAMGGMSKDDIRSEEILDNQDEIVMHGTDIDQEDMDVLTIITGEDDL